jgi:hypothetical protein
VLAVRRAAPLCGHDGEVDRYNCFVTHLSIGIGDKHFNEISYQVGDANLSVTTPFTCESVKSALADERNRIAQRLTKGF